MTPNETRKIDEFVKKQTNALCDLWYSCEPDRFFLPVTTPFEEKLENERKLTAMLEWLGNQLEHPNMDQASRKALSFETVKRLKYTGTEIFGLTEDQVNCFEELGIDQAAIEFFRQAQAFDPTISTSDLFQASRNVWTCNYLQALLGLPVKVTPSIFAYSMLYPVSDNYLDDPHRSRHEKAAFNQRFRAWLKGEPAVPQNWNEKDVLDLVTIIESQYPRQECPQVYDSLLAIHSAQDKSMCIPHAPVAPNSVDVLGLTFEKGGTSVLADGFLAAGELTKAQMEIIFNYGAFAQLMDDQEDLERDLKDKSLTLFTEAARVGKVDETMHRVFGFAHHVLKGLESFKDERVKPLKHMSMKGIDLLLIDAVLRMEKNYSRTYLKELETHFPFRFEYLKRVRKTVMKKKITAERLIGLMSSTQIPSYLPIDDAQYLLLVGI
ncbi:MAG: hypothetical protein FD147_825 [Chloroflexi bacterium]|nr:MAG: hypothetical protein FD147_825 [Chloroflexota bacterium]